LLDDWLLAERRVNDHLNIRQALMVVDSFDECAQDPFVTPQGQWLVAPHFKDFGFYIALSGPNGIG
jgi:hypothetical protein